MNKWVISTRFHIGCCLLIMLAGWSMPSSAQSPNTTIDSPLSGSVIDGNIALSGTATASSGVDYVELTFRNKNSGQYWNGSAWQSGFVRYPVSVSPAGGESVTWSETIAASNLVAGDYLARAWSRAADGSGDPVGNARIDITWEEPSAEIIAPPPNSTLTQTSQEVSWRSASSFFWIYAGPSRGSADFFNSGLIRTSTSAVVDGLPNDGSAVWLRLWYWHGGRDGRWHATDAQYTTTPDNAMTLVFAEEFNSFDSAHWTREHSTYGDGNNELQCYTPQQVAVRGGSLILTAENRVETCPNGSTRQVTSGMVRSKGVTFSPGQYIEYRVKLTPNDESAQGGLWPAFWASGWAGGGWPLGGEWDGLEVMTAVDPARVSFDIHYNDSSSRHRHSPKKIDLDENFSANWHVLGFRYGINGVLTWYLDGQAVYEVTNADTQQGWPAPFDQSMRELKINLALGGTPGPLQDSALPATYQIDYVRIYDY